MNWQDKNMIFLVMFYPTLSRNAWEERIAYRSRNPGGQAVMSTTIQKSRA
ncbi:MULTISPECIES: hypothetical protein [unclassified Mesorhizobium]